jgi:hypothetical protein
MDLNVKDISIEERLGIATTSAGVRHPMIIYTTASNGGAPPNANEN